VSPLRRLLTLRFLRFALVGASGVAINMGALWLLTTSVGLPVPVASVIAIELSILSNFTLNDLWTWRGVDKKRYPVRAGQYHASVAVTAVLNWLILVGLHSGLGVHYLVANLAGIAVGTLLNFFINDAWTFRARPR
jgi:dolichol-phosphate mannosyltransferase